MWVVTINEKNKLRVYTLNRLPPEVVAVAFAKSSRSPEPFDIIADELSDEKSAKFHEKWVVGYGHSSVAEHAVLSIAIENVSILATKIIEDNRLASYTEKSTRYQVFDKTKYYKPKKLMESSLGRVYEETSDFIFDSYVEMIKVIIPFLKKKYPQENQPDKLYEIQINNKALDNIRYVLTVATLTNLGMTINARNLEHAAVKLLSHPLKEMKDIGKKIKEAAVKVTPTLIKYVEPNTYLIETEKDLQAEADSIAINSEAQIEGNMVTLVEFDEDAENKVICGILYRFTNHTYNEIKKRVMYMQREEKEKIIDYALKKIGKFDWPIRELEHCYYTFDILMDYGAFRDVQRHRMVTQTNQELGIDHGYCIPEEVKEAGLENIYRECMKRAEESFNNIKKEFPKEASYIVPLAYRKRTLFKCNLRELYHFIKIRSGKRGHVSYRKIAQEMYLLIKEKHPLLSKYIEVDMSYQFLN